VWIKRSLIRSKSSEDVDWAMKKTSHLADKWRKVPSSWPWGDLTIINGCQQL
jgi:hypothetical protein